jgi:hypothetical protein
MSNLHQEQILEQKKLLNEIYENIEKTKKEFINKFSSFIYTLEQISRETKDIFERNKTKTFSIDPRLMAEILNYLEIIRVISRIMAHRTEELRSEENIRELLYMLSNVSFDTKIMYTAYASLEDLVYHVKASLDSILEKLQIIKGLERGPILNYNIHMYRMAPEETEEKFRKIDDELKIVKNQLESYREELIKKYKTIDMAPPDEIRILRILEKKTETLRGELERLLKETYTKVPFYDKTLFFDTRKYLNLLLQPFGERCGWIREEDYLFTNYVDVRLLLNEVANCAHAVASTSIKLFSKILSTLESGKITVEGKHSVLIGDVNPMIKEFVKRWEKYVDENNRIGYYYSEDYPMLSAVGMKDRLEMRVGSSPGHKTRVEIRDGSLYMRYFDVDTKVNETLHDLLTEKKFKCRIITGERFNDGVECVKDNFTIEDVDALARAISLVTSMDVNLDERPDFVNNRIRELFPEIFKEEVRK